LTTVEAASIERPELRVWVSGYRTIKQAAFNRIHRRKINTGGWLPPPFRFTMSAPIDDRLDKMTQGLGVIVDERGKFYPMNALMNGPVDDKWEQGTLRVSRGEIDGVPHAIWVDDGGPSEREPPMQLLTRWYGFAFTWPGCAIFEPPTDADG
jgi:hypothetical protein